MTDMDRRSFLSRSATGLAAAGLLPSLALARTPDPDAGLRVAVVGAGSRGRAMLAELMKIDGASAVAVCEPDERRRQAGLGRTAGARGFPSLRAALDSGDPLDAIAIATPTHRRADVALEAIASGRHVLIDAPLAHTVEGCTVIARAAAGATGVVASGAPARANPLYQHARGFFRTESVGDLVSINAVRRRKTSWRFVAAERDRDAELNWRLDPARSIGLPGEWGVSAIDLVHWYTGELPMAVRGRGDLLAHDDGREIPDTVHCDFELPSGARFTLDASLASSFGAEQEELVGVNGAIRLAQTHGWLFKEADAPTQGWEVYATRESFHRDEGIVLIADATKLASEGRLTEGVGLPHAPLHYAMADWLAAAADGSPPSSPIDPAARATAVAIAAHRATMLNDRVEIDLSALPAPA